MSEQLKEIDRVTRLWLAYRESLKTAQSMQQGGFAVPNTKMNDFVGTINSLSKVVLREVGTTDQAYMEALGELILNAAHCMKMQQQDKNYIW